MEGEEGSGTTFGHRRVGQGTALGGGETATLDSPPLPPPPAVAARPFNVLHSSPLVR